ncbi:hypothetical protein BDV93DRAFT_519970 [Ceratobasidium sp. AG-I]|nr:hypothetical protein BDV93DRAFT_519970 [Ceratobasidium sp. AG-I]
MATYQTVSDAPIYRLPSELLAEIFTIWYLIDSHISLPVAQVSRDWRALALSMPTLWTRIQLENEAEATVYIKRSEPLLLDLHANWRNLGSLDLKQDMLRVKQNWHRWERITFKLINHEKYNPLAKSIHHQLNALMQPKDSVDFDSQLQYFSFTLLRQGYQLVGEEPVVFPRIRSLQHVELIGVPLRPLSTIPPRYFSNMRELRMASIPSIRAGFHIIPLISAMPVLTKLTIEDSKGGGGYEGFGGDQEVVLECLETLELMNVHNHIAGKLLEAISAPNLRRLALHSTPLSGLMLPDPWQHAASNYHNLRYLSISGTQEDTLPILPRWLENLNELEHLDISLFCQEVTSEVVHVVLKKLADSGQNVCPSLLRLQVGEGCDLATCELLKDVVKSRGTGGFIVVVPNGDEYKEFVL